MASEPQQPWFLQSRYPVLFPHHPALFLPKRQFEAFLQADLAARNNAASCDSCDSAAAVATSSDFTMVDAPPVVSDVETEEAKGQENPPPKMLTENGDVAFRSSGNPLVDLFQELEEVVGGERVPELLDAAWHHDPLATLKIIFHARSIHLGKGTRHPFYRCAGWLFEHHPLTLVSNLQWLTRPLIEKKAEPKQEAKPDDTMADLVDVAAWSELGEPDEADPSSWDVRNGLAHGYWKDLPNILALAANGKLGPMEDPRVVLNVHQRRHKLKGLFGKSPPAVIPEDKSMDTEPAQARRHRIRDERHATAVRLFGEDAAYRALHLTVARLYAEQLKLDLTALHAAASPSDQHKVPAVSLCAKWAPSATRFHDKHTFVVSSIAEIMHPASEYPGIPLADRETYLRHAREAYRQDLTKLRAHLDVVERNLTAGTLSRIDYGRLPSQAMKQYAWIFASKDKERFEAYLDQVATGEARISGATLLPSTLVHAVRSRPVYAAPRTAKSQQMLVKKAIMRRVADYQWKTVVQRIRDSGTLDSSIAVCDISGSMMSPEFPDGTCPMDSSIGLSLLLAEIAQPPFRGMFISFSSDPSINVVDLSASFSDKVRSINSSLMGFNTDFVAVFEKLILPLAIQNKLTQKDMVKRVFVFSDMQFDAAESDVGMKKIEEKWSTSYERVEAAYRAAGYELPELVFWNLAGGRAGTAPKPVQSDQPGTAMLSGYSQAMLKVFLDNSSFETPEEEELIQVEKEEGDDVIVEVKKKPLDSVQLLNKAISHKAYNMLKVYD